MTDTTGAEDRYRRLVKARAALQAAADALAAEEESLLRAHPSLLVNLTSCAEPALAGPILPLFPEGKPC